MKHAYLIMAHHRPDLLRRLIDALDDERNDIYIHIDIKASGLEWDTSSINAHVYIIAPMNVIWGHYSQVECEYRLYKAAYKNGPYSYYHMMTGVSYPIKSQDYIHDFFIKHNGYEFIGFDNNHDYSYRIRYKQLCPKHGKRKGKIGRLLYIGEDIYFFLQKISGRDYLKKYNMVCKKGLVYTSITNGFVRYLLDHEIWSKDALKDSISGDEVFIQTIAYNSSFREKIYNLEDEFLGCLRVTPWEDKIPGRREFQFELEDFDYLKKSDALFAFKFDGSEGVQLLDKIKSDILETSLN